MRGSQLGGSMPLAPREPQSSDKMRLMFLLSPHRPASSLTSPINGVGCQLPSHHQYHKANRSRLAFFIAGCRGFAGARAGSCGLRGSAHHAVSTRISLSPGHSSLLVGSVPVGEVRKRPNFCRCNSDSYARTIQAVGWQHW